MKKKQKAKKSTAGRLQPATSTEDLLNILQIVNGEGLGGFESYVERRPRTSRSETNWEVLTEEVWNTERYQYRIGECPPLRRQEDDVVDEDGNRRPLEFARRMIGLARRARKTKKDLTIAVGAEDGDDEYSVIIHRSGNINMGCQEFDWDELEKFARSQGWKSK